MRVHSIIEDSLVNGPGSRLTIWSQGCTKGCKGCFNPETWTSSGGTDWTSSSLVELVERVNPDGLTLTGGDPLEQPSALREFLELLHDRHPGLEGILPKGIILFTGYVIEELGVLEEGCLQFLDVVIDGRFVEALRYPSGLAGSSNQRFHFSNAPGRGRARIEEFELEIDQSIEVGVDSSGLIEVTGFPLIDRRILSKLGLRVVP